MNRQATKWYIMIAILITAGAIAALSQAAEAGLSLSEAWMRPTLGAGRTTAAYLTITNTSAIADRLVAADVPGAGAVEIHTAGMEDGIMRMRRVEGIDIPAGESVQLAPGGLHIMVMALSEPVTTGAQVPLTLVFEKAGSLIVRADVTLAPPAASAMPPEMGHESGNGMNGSDMSGSGMDMPDNMHHGH